MNIFLKSLVVVMVSWAVVEAVPAPDDGPPTTFDETDFWTDCVQDYDDPAGVCKQSGFSVTKKPDGSYTKAKQVNHLWTAGVNKCSDAPKRVRFFCSKDHSQAYWQGMFSVRTVRAVARTLILPEEFLFKSNSN